MPTADGPPAGRGRLLAFGLLTLVAVVTCIRLGIWQLDRLAQRRAYNASVAARAAEPPLDGRALLHADTGALRWRRATVAGRADYTRDVAVAARTRAGSPGVWLVTPVSLPGTDTVLALVRGWVYSADGRRVAFDEWREADSLAVAGRVDAFHTPRRGAPRLEAAPRAFRWLERDTLEAEWERPVAPLLVYQLPDSAADTIGGVAATAGRHPARIPPPALDEGPHQSYALQWFGFATVFAVGFGVMLARRRRSGPAAS